MRNFIIGLIMLAIAAYFIMQQSGSKESSKAGNAIEKKVDAEPAPIKLPDAAPALASDAVTASAATAK